MSGMAVRTYTDLTDRIIAQTSGFLTDFRDTMAASTSITPQEREDARALVLANAVSGSPTLTALVVDNNALITGGLSVGGGIALEGGLLATGLTPIGYGEGVLTAVTQLTSKSTGVTANSITAEITTHNAALSDNTTVTFTVTNSVAAAGMRVVVNHISGGSGDQYLVWGHTVTNGSYKISIRNVSGGPESQPLVLGCTLFYGGSA